MLKNIFPINQKRAWTVRLAPAKMHYAPEFRLRRKFRLGPSACLRRAGRRLENDGSGDTQPSPPLAATS